jgi:uncharacterized membrane protein YhaH (DUF805 family)
MTFPAAILTVFRNYAVFDGRASRAEFWWWILFTALVNAALNAVTLAAVPVVAGVPYVPVAYQAPSGIATAWSIAVLVPTIAVAVRRLRDAGHRWPSLLWLLVPVAGIVVVIVLCAQPSVPTPTMGVGPHGEPGQLARS